MTQPKLRFAQFDGDWEQYKVGDFLTESRISGTNGLTAKKLTVKLWGKGVVCKEEIYSGSQATKYYIRKSGQFIYGKLDFLNQAFGIIPNSLDGYESTLDAPAFDISKDLNADFFLRYVLRKEFYLYQGMQANGSRKAKRIHSDTFLEMPITLPSIAEQTTIGNFFRQVDKLIALHQGKLDNIKTLKKGLLQKMFPAQGETVPQIRFPQFTDDWEIRKLGEISEKVKEKNKNREFIETLTNSAELGVISQRDFFDKEISNIDNITNYYIVKHNDFIYNPRISNLAPVGPIKRNKLGRTGVMSPLYYVFRLNSDVEPSYLEIYFETKIWHKFMYLNGDTGARSDRFAIKDNIFVQMPIMLPSIKEQTTIGNFFRQLDDLINLHQRKLEHLKGLKKSLLQQMFV